MSHRTLSFVSKLTAAVAAVLLLFAAGPVSAKTFTTLTSFNGTDGSNPSFGALVQGTDGNFYGTTRAGGANGQGTVFKITPAGVLTTLYSFCSFMNSQGTCTDGNDPYGGLVQGTNGNFYGTTFYGGASGYGTVFKITSAGALTTLYSFCSQTNCTDGRYPWAGLIQAANGGFYGTTYGGAVSGADCPIGCGTIFEITPAGRLTTLYTFCSQANCTDGTGPAAGLMQGANGNFYGTTVGGGANSLNNNEICTDAPGCGTVFEITAAGTLTTLYSFCAQANCADGASPYGNLVQGANGNFYGTTLGGGNNGEDAGTVFEVTSTGALTSLYSFSCTVTSCVQGAAPYAGLVRSGGNFYGTTSLAGAYENTFCEEGFLPCGTIFEITPTGNLNTLYSFCSRGGCPDGNEPYAGLVQGTDGSFYGTTYYDGFLGPGTVFRLSMGLAPFAETRPTSGKVAARVIILGNNLTGTSSVSFNGTAATFTVNSDTEITTMVPTGASTGEVEVTTPGGTLSSNVSFRVLP